MPPSYLLAREKGQKRRKPILEVVAKEVADAGDGKVLVVAPKKVLIQLQADAHENNRAGTEPASDRLLGASARWFGPNLQGINDFEDYKTVVVVGRLQPRVSALEDKMRCLFGDGVEPLQFASDGRLTRLDVERSLADDSSRWRQALGCGAAFPADARRTPQQRTDDLG